MAKKAHSQLMLDEEEDDLEDDADDDDFILNDEDDDDVMDFNGNMDGFEESTAFIYSNNFFKQ